MNTIFTEINRLIEEKGERIVITSHKNPDGDAAGSALGLLHILEAKGFKPVVILPDSLPAFLNWMPGAGRIVFFDTEKENANQLFRSATLIFCLDYNEMSRTGDMEKIISSAGVQKIMIDHHPFPSNEFTIKYSDTSCCATSEMICRFAEYSGNAKFIGRNAATCLYAGIMTDSGSFRFPSTSADTHKTAAMLIEKGVDHSHVYSQVWDTFSEDRLRLLGFAITQKMTLLKNSKTVYFILTKEELGRYNYRKGDTEGLVNYGLSIDGILASVLFCEHNDRIKISFRSKENVAVNEFARSHFEGGGHKNAAGASSRDPLAQVTGKFLENFPQFMKKYVE